MNAISTFARLYDYALTPTSRSESGSGSRTKAAATRHCGRILPSIMLDNKLYYGDNLDVLTNAPADIVFVRDPRREESKQSCLPFPHERRERL